MEAGEEVCRHEDGLGAPVSERACRPMALGREVAGAVAARAGAWRACRCHDRRRGFSRVSGGQPPSLGSEPTPGKLPGFPGVDWQPVGGRGPPDTLPPSRGADP